MVSTEYRQTLSRWECDSGHVLEGLFYSHSKDETTIKMPMTITCPNCGHEMTLSREEGTHELLRRVREFVGRASQHPDYEDPASHALKDLRRLETVVRRLADDALRP